MSKLNYPCLVLAICVSASLSDTALATNLETMERNFNRERAEFEKEADEARERLVGRIERQMRLARSPEKLRQELQTFKLFSKLPTSDDALSDAIEYIKEVNAAAIGLRGLTRRYRMELERKGDRATSQLLKRESETAISNYVPTPDMNKTQWMGTRLKPSGLESFSLEILSFDGDRFIGLVVANGGRASWKVAGSIVGNIVDMEITQMLKGPNRRLHFEGHAIGDRMKLVATGITTTGAAANHRIDLHRMP